MKYVYPEFTCRKFLVFRSSSIVYIFFNFNLFYFFCKGLAEKVHHFTLLDGEMIIDTVPDTRKQERRYLIYDLMAINQVSIIEVKFDHLPSPLFFVGLVTCWFLLSKGG